MRALERDADLRYRIGARLRELGALSAAGCPTRRRGGEDEAEGQTVGASRLDGKKGSTWL